MRIQGACLEKCGGQLHAWGINLGAFQRTRNSLLRFITHYHAVKELNDAAISTCAQIGEQGYPRWLGNCFPKGKGQEEAIQVLSQDHEPLCLCLAAPRELKTRKKVHLPTNDVVETPRKLHGRSHSSLEAGANQSEHVLGEN